MKIIAKKYEECCYGTVAMTKDSFRNEIYELEQAIYRISKFGMKTIERAVDDIVREQ